MDLKKEFKVGDRVLCVQERNIPKFIGTVWTIIDIRYEFIYCENKTLYPYADDECYIFKKSEIVPITPLMEELL